MEYLENLRVAQYDNSNTEIAEFLKKHKGNKGRPSHFSDVFVLCENGEFTKATYGKYTQISEPSFLVNKNGLIITLNDVKHWTY